jgi:hypothetical protein
MRKDRPDDVDGAGERARDRPVEVVGIGGDETSVGGGAGVHDDQVEPAERVDRCRHGIAHATAVAHIRG